MQGTHGLDMRKWVLPRMLPLPGARLLHGLIVS
jgi:hypothetical protein